MTAHPPQPGITIWSSGGHKQSLWNKRDVILSAIFYQHYWPYGYKTVWWAFIFPLKVALFNAPSSFFTDKHCVLPGGNCTIHRINIQSYIQEWIMVCVLLHRLLQVSADILSSGEGWEIKKSLPVSFGNMGLWTQVTNKCLAIGYRGQQARFLLLITTWFA